MKRLICILLLFNYTIVACSKINSETIVLNTPTKQTNIGNNQEQKKEESPDGVKEKKIEKDSPVPIEKLSHEKHGWGLSVTTNETSPGIPDSWKKMLERFDGFYIGPVEQKKVYLTFDCGYENGYTEDIINVLVKNKVPAIFFIVGHYITSRPDLVKKMADHGFLIGNHTVNHSSIPTLTDTEINKEVLGLNESIKKLTGKEPIYFRPPSGEFSEYSLAVVSNLGFKTIFWSLALRDWIPLPGGAEESYNTIMERIHPGAIILLHAVSKDNHDAMQRIIDGIRAKGYEFAPIDF